MPAEAWQFVDIYSSILVMPKGDGFDHSYSEECECKPEVDEHSFTDEEKIRVRKFVSHNDMSDDD